MSHRAHCGMCQLRKKAIVYGFGSNNGKIWLPRFELTCSFSDFRWEDSLRRVRPDLSVHVFDPTLDQTIHQGNQAQATAKKAGYNFISMGLAYRDGELEMKHPGGVAVWKDGWGEKYGKTGGEIASRTKKKAAGVRRTFKVPTTTLDKLMAKLGHDQVSR